MAAETIEQLPDGEPPTHIFLQAGVGGMAAASSAQFWLRFGGRHPTTVLVKPRNSACWFESLKARRPVVIGGDIETVMGGLACGEISCIAWEILSVGTHAMIKIRDEDACDCVCLLVEGR